VISKADLIEYLLDRPYAAEMKLQPNSFRSIMGLSEELLETRCGGSGGILPSISFRDTRSYRASSSGSWTVFKDSDAFPPDDELIVIKKEETSGTFKFIGNQIKFWAGGSLPLARLNRSPVQYSSMGVHSYQVHNGTVDITVENKTRPFGAHWENHLGLDFVVGQAFGAELEVFAPVAGRIVYVNDGGPGSDCGVSIAVGPYTLTYYSLDHDGLLNSAVYLNVAVVNGGLVNAGDRIGSMMVIPGLPRRILHWGVSTGLLRDTCPYHWLENAGRKQVEAMANWDTGVGVVEPYVCNPNRPLEYFGSPACPLRTVWQNECLASASAGSDERPWRLETEKGLSEGRCLYLSNGAVAADDVCINAAAGLPGEQVVFTSDEYRYKWCIGDGACSGGLLELLTNGEGISNRGTVLFQFDSGQGQQPITKERLVRLKWSGGHASEMVLCREVVLDGCGAELPVACMADETCVCDIYTPAIADPCVAR
jgi:murein DD-endopeptidase MepM/ murein hydrolase activator NlpD